MWLLQISVHRVWRPIECQGRDGRFDRSAALNLITQTSAQPHRLRHWGPASELSSELVFAASAKVARDVWTAAVWPVH